MNGGIDVRVIAENARHRRRVTDVAEKKLRSLTNSERPVERLSRMTGMISWSTQAEATVLPM
jgi:hypothetical protein